MSLWLFSPSNGSCGHPLWRAALRFYWRQGWRFMRQKAPQSGTSWNLCNSFKSWWPSVQSAVWKGETPSPSPWLATSTWGGKSNGHMSPVRLPARVVPRKHPIKWREVSGMLGSPSESWLQRRLGFERQSPWENQNQGGGSAECPALTFRGLSAVQKAPESPAPPLSLSSNEQDALPRLPHGVHEENPGRHTRTKAKAVK